MTPMMKVAVPIIDIAKTRRLNHFASDVAQLAAERRDHELRELIADLHEDLMRLRADDE